MQDERRIVQEHELSPPLRRVYKMIEARALEHEHDVSIPLLTRRDIANNYRRIRIKHERGRRAKRTGLAYPVASRLVKRLIDMGLVVEEDPPTRSRQRGRPLGLRKPTREPEPEPRESKVIIAHPKKKGRRKSQ